jgi:hypothetical protein
MGYLANINRRLAAGGRPMIKRIWKWIAVILFIFLVSVVAPPVGIALAVLLLLYVLSIGLAALGQRQFKRSMEVE